MSLLHNQEPATEPERNAGASSPLILDVYETSFSESYLRPGGEPSNGLLDELSEPSSNTAVRVALQ